MSGLGSPSDPCLSPLAWSVTGKYLASAMEKMVNIWQVNGKLLFIFPPQTSLQSSICFYVNTQYVNGLKKLPLYKLNSYYQHEDSTEYEGDIIKIPMNEKGFEVGLK